MKEALSTCAPASDGANEATIVSAENGTVRVCFTNELNTPGIYWAAFGVFEEYTDETDPDNPELIQTLKYEQEFYIVVEASVWGANSSLPRWTSLREQMADFSGENTLTLQQRFSDADLASAAVYCVEIWNESLPATNVRYDTTSFPWRAFWLDGIKGRLFMLHAERLRSTHLPISGGGITVNDKDKYDQYDQRGLYLWQQFLQHVKMTKIRINMVGGASARTMWGYGGG